MDAGKFDVTNSLCNDVATGVLLLTLIFVFLLPLSRKLRLMTSIGCPEAAKLGPVITHPAGNPIQFNPIEGVYGR